ncbi:hypothetical protein Tco_0758461, partial [Tanacetum coccineum]
MGRVLNPTCKPTTKALSLVCLAQYKALLGHGRGSELGSELRSELTLLAGIELKTSEVDTSKLKTSEYRFLKIFILASYEQELCQFNFLLTSCQLSSSELRIASYSSDTRPPMLETDFASWQQRIRLYYRGKDNEVNILKSIDEGPFQMGTFRETLAEGKEGAFHLGPERSRVYSDLLHEDKERFSWKRKGETIHDYNVWFAKLINDIQNIKMTMSRMQLNSKFVNNMLPEWGRFVTAVKLNRGLRDSNYDQMYAYLKQHEAHANENKMMLDRFTQHTVDPLALISNVAPQQYNSQSSTNPPSTYGRQNRGHGNNARGAGAAGYGGAQNRVRNANPEYFKDKMLPMQAQENGVALDEDQLLFIAGGKDNPVDEDVDEQPTMFMANLSSADLVYDEAGPSYVLNTLSEVHGHDHYQDAVYEHHDEHKMHDDVQPNYVVDSHADYTSDSNMILYDQYLKDNA